MNKSDLVAAMAAKTGDTKKSAEEALNAFVDVVTAALVEGDKVYITDTTGQKITYIIYKIYTTSPEDGSYLDRDTAGKREISLTTCTDDSQSRLIVWAKEQ